MDLGDIQDARLLWLKAALFTVLGAFSVVFILLLYPDLLLAALLGLTIWSFSRAYYFCFYVIHHYIDPSFRYKGIVSALQHLWAYGPHGREGGAAATTQRYLGGRHDA